MNRLLRATPLALVLAAACAGPSAHAPTGAPPSDPGAVAVAGVEPVEPGPGDTAPRCRGIPSIRAPRSLPPLNVEVRFAVGLDGKVSRFEVLAPPLPPEVAASIRDAVVACAWTPGRDRAGTPVPMWVVTTFRFR